MSLYMPPNVRAHTLSNVIKFEPLVVFTFTNGEALRFSTRGLDIDGVYYEDRGLKVSSISEALDYKTHKYKISNATVTISNYIREGLRFSDLIDPTTKELLNSTAEIYYAAGNTISDIEADAIKIYKGKVVSCVMDSKSVSIGIEDASQSVLNNISLPKDKVDPELVFMDSQKNSVIPILFGFLYKAPLVFQALSRDSADMVLISDNVYREDIAISAIAPVEWGLFVLLGDTYFRIPEFTEINHILQIPTGNDQIEDFAIYNGERQWSVHDTSQYVVFKREYTEAVFDVVNDISFIGAKNLIARGFLQVSYLSHASTAILSEGQTYVSNGVGLLDYVGEHYDFDNIGNSFYFPSQDGSTQITGRVNNVGFGDIRRYNEGTDNFVHDSNRGGIHYLQKWLGDQATSGDWLIDNRYEVVYTPRRAIQDDTLKEAYTKFLIYVYMKMIEEGNHSDTLNDMISCWHLAGSPDLGGYNGEVIDWFVRQHMMLEQQGVIDGNWNAQASGLSFGTSEPDRFWYHPLDPRRTGYSSYAWHWNVDNVPAAYITHPNHIPSAAGQTTRFMELYLPVRFVTYQAQADELSTAEHPDTGSIYMVDFHIGWGYEYERVWDRPAGDWKYGILWDDLIGQRGIYESGEVAPYRVNAILPSMVIEPIGYSDGNTGTGWDAVVVSQTAIEDHSMPWGWYARRNFMNANVWPSWGATDNPDIEGAPGATQYPGFSDAGVSWRGWTEGQGGQQGTWEKHIEFSPYIEMGGYKGIYTGIVANQFHVSSGYQIYRGFESYKIQAWHQPVNTFPMYAGTLESTQDTIQIYSTGSTPIEGVGGVGEVENYQSRFRVVFPLANISSTNIVKDSCHTYYHANISSDITLNQIANTDGFQWTVNLQTNDTENPLSPILSVSNSYSGQTVTAETTEDNAFFVGENTSSLNYPYYPDAMFLLDPTAKNLSDTTSIHIEVGITGINALETADAQFTLYMNNIALIQLALLEKIEDNRYFSASYGRIDYTGDFTGQLNNIIHNPQDILHHLLVTEGGFTGDFIGKGDALDAMGSSWLMDFAVNEEIEFKKLIQDITKETRMCCKFNTQNGSFQYIAFPDNPIPQHTMDSESFIKVKFNKTKIDNIVLKCRVIYGYDYGLEEFLEATNTSGGGAVPNNLDEAMTYYGIDNIDNHYLEVEAKHLASKFSAEMLRNHLVEYYKNSRLMMRAELTMKWIDLEAGDVFEYNLSTEGNYYIDNLKPYGLSYMEQGEKLGQTVMPNWRITKISKKTDRITVEAEQVHILDENSLDIQDPASSFTEIPPVPDPDTVLIQLGDVNMDGSVDILDIVLMINYILGNIDLGYLEVIEDDDE